MDLPEPQGADAVLAAMEAAQAGFDTAAERRLLNALATAELLVPLVADAASGKTYAARLAGEDGRQALVAFTHPAAAEAFEGGDDVRFGVLAARELAATAIPADAGLVLNPGGPFAGQLDRRALESIAAAGALGAATPTGPDPDAGFEVRAPRRPPTTALVEALQTAVTTAPTLREAWYAEVTGAGPDHGLLVLVGDGEEPPETVADVLERELADGEVVDLLPVEAAAWDAGDYAQVKDVAQLI